MKKYRYYTGVGSRSTPPDILALMYKIAESLGYDGYVLRSGGARGADTAFENGADGFMWMSYRTDGFLTSEYHKKLTYNKLAWDEARSIASQVHPAWERCSDYAKQLHTRNVFQVLGRELNAPSEFLICYTPDGATCHEECTRDTGGTATAIRVASMHNIPIYNLARKEHKKYVEENILKTYYHKRV